MGAYIVLYPRAQIITLLPILFYPFFFELPAVLYLGLWFYSQLLSGVLSLVGPDQIGGIAWWAHIGGFVAGAVLWRMFVRPERPFQADEYGIERAFVR
jgi:membrane associated rhomboid family serine protease